MNNNIDLKNIIPPGSIIRTKHPKSEWITNVVYKITDNCIQIELTQEYLNNLVFVGDSITCKSSTAEAEFLLEGVISNIDINGSKFFTICIDKVNVFQNTRNCHRYDTYMISKVATGINSYAFCIVTSISSSGISVLSKQDLQLNSKPRIEVFIDSGNTIEFEGEIVRKSETENGFDFGVKFVNLNKESQAVLDEVLSQLESKYDSLLNKYLSNLRHLNSI